MISDKGYNLIKEFESLELTAYPDPGTGAEPWTIGYGHTKGVNKGDTCTVEQANAWLVEDAEEAWLGVLEIVKIPITINQLDALTSFVFNLGIGKLKSSTLLKKLNAGQIEEAADEFLRWNMAAGKVLNGLTRRRQAERKLFLGE